MLTEIEMPIAEKFIELHKQHGGTVSHDMRFNFMQSIGQGFIDMNPIIDKLIAMELIKYKLPNQTGLTTLTQKGWDFVSINDHFRTIVDQHIIDKMTIEKLRLDLIKARREAKMFWWLIGMTVVMFVFSVYSFISGIVSNQSQEALQEKLYRIERKLQEVDTRIQLEQTDAKTK